jgi:hypothetical protein
MLNAAKPSIRSLTFILALEERKLDMTTTALGLELNPIAFADFLWYNGAIMAAVRDLSPKTLNVIMKKSGKKYMMSVDMTYHQAACEETSLANTETIRLAEAKALEVKTELMSLKETFEEMHKNPDLVAQNGKCRLLGDSEGVSSASDSFGAGSSASSTGEASRAYSKARSLSPNDRESTVDLSGSTDYFSA